MYICNRTTTSRVRIRAKRSAFFLAIFTTEKELCTSGSTLLGDLRLECSDTIGQVVAVGAYDIPSQGISTIYPVGFVKSLQSCK